MSVGGFHTGKDVGFFALMKSSTKTHDGDSKLPRYHAHPTVIKSNGHIVVRPCIGNGSLCAVWGIFLCAGIVAFIYFLH